MNRGFAHFYLRKASVLAFGLILAGCSDASTGEQGSSAGSSGAPAAGTAGLAAGGQTAEGVTGGAAVGGLSGASGVAGALVTAGASSGGAPAGGAANGGGGAGGAIAGVGGGAAGSAGAAAGSGGTGGKSGFGGMGGTAGMSASAGSGAGGAGGAAPVHTGAWRITPLGDSITGTTCGPQLLSSELKSKGKTNFAFFGNNLNNQSCNGAANVQTEGHGGYLVTDLVGTGKHASELPMWSSSDKAEIVLMHFGTNDVWNNVPASTILSAYTTVLASFRAVNPKLIILVAQIIPMNPSGCSACESRVEALNAQIPAWASSTATAGSPIYVVDQHSVFTPATYTPSSMYTADGVHPNVAGAQLMADKWYAALSLHGIP